MVLLIDAEFSVVEFVLALEVTEEVGRIDDRDHRVHPGHVTQALPVLVLEGERRGHRHRLTDPGGLDREVVEPTHPGESIDLDHQVFAQRAADASIEHLDHLLVCSRQFSPAVSNERGIDVHFGHIVHDHRDLETLTVQYVVEEGGLTCAEKAGKDGDGRWVSRHGVLLCGNTQMTSYCQ